MDELLTVLQETQHPVNEIRQRAEAYLQDAMSHNGFVRSLLDVAACDDCPIHLRQLSLVLIIQQVRKHGRYVGMGADIHALLLEFSFVIMASSENNLKNSGAVLLACIFLNGSEEERDHIISQLFSVFNSDDLDNIYLASRCLCEILEEATFQSQVDILVGCDCSLRNIVVNIDRSQVHIVRNIAKVYRLVAFRVCDARLANDFTADIDDSMTAIFSSWMSVMVQWCSADMDTEGILQSLGVLIEVVQFLAVVGESFPAMCSPSQLQSSSSSSTRGQSSDMISAIMRLAWRYLHSLVGVYSEVCSTEYSCYGHVAHDGDRIEVGVFVMHLFELLKICINISSQQSHAMQLGQQDMNDLMGMLVQYMRLSEMQVDQYLEDGNDFVAADQDDSLELSLRHTGCDFVHEMFMSSPGRIFEAIVSKVESDLTSFYGLLSGGDGAQEEGKDLHELLGRGVLVQEPLCIPEEQVTLLEASLFALRCMGRKFIKRYLRSKRFGGGGNGRERTGDSVEQSQTTHLEEEVARLQSIISGLVNTFFNDNFLQLASSSPRDSDGDGDDPCKLCICRGIISSLLSSYSQILPTSSLNFLLSVMVQFSSPSFAITECMAARLYHCSALGVLVNLAVKHYNYSILTTDHMFERIMESFLDICTHSNDSTVHIPLENITHLLSTASTALRSSAADPATSDLPHFLPPAAIEQLTLLGLSTWATYRDDPFSVEITRELFLSLLAALAIDGHGQCVEHGGSDERVTLFCQVYFPHLEEVVADMSLGESMKNLGDVALRVLVESMAGPSTSSSSSSSSAAGGETGGSNSTLISMLGVPTLQALARVFAMSLENSEGSDGKDEGYRIDIGETLRSLSLFFSIEELEFCSLDPAICSEIISNVLNSANHVLYAADEFNYPLVCGCLSHLLVHFSSVMDDMSDVVALLQHIVQLICDAKRADNARNILAMGIVHIFCRNPALVSSALGTMSLSPTSRDTNTKTKNSINGLGFMIDTWFDLHPLLESSYNRHISTLGLLHVLELYLQQGMGEAFLCRVLQLVVRAVSAAENDTEEDYETNEAALSTFSLYSDDEEEDDDYYEQSEGEEEDEDEEGGGSDNPFAPAEMYLSDLIDMSGAGGGRGGHVYVPDNLMYLSPRQDPLFTSVTTKQRLQELVSRNQDPQGFLMRCVKSLDEDTQHLLGALLR